MSVKRSNIEWTDFSGGDANFVLRGVNPGECEVSPGCAHCYALSILKRIGSKASPITTWNVKKLWNLEKVKLDDGKENRRGPGSRPMVFVCDMADLFHPKVPENFILDAILYMGFRPDADFQILTKRIDVASKILTGRTLPDNVWIGTSIENQKTADERIPWLTIISAKVRFLSVEPMLGPISLVPSSSRHGYGLVDYSKIHWVICGGESGSCRRYFDKAWAVDLYDECRRMSIPFFFKQGSHQYPGRDDELPEIGKIKEFPHASI